MIRSAVTMCLVAGMTLGSNAQQATRVLQFSLDRAGAVPVQYAVMLGEDGKGTYTVQPPTAGSTAAPARSAEGQPIEVAAGTVKKMFAAVPTVEGGRCETHSKGIAQTGVKVMRYQGADKRAECTFNYSDDDRLNTAATLFEAVAETLQAGDRLRAKLRFDRLGLDQELEQLRLAVADHRALELQNIAPVLKSIMLDERVMDRARRKAELLLDGAQTTQARSDMPASER